MTITIPIIAADGTQSTVTLAAPVVNAGFGQPIMPAPPGFTNLVFHDAFPGTSLNLAKWNPALGAQGGLWNNFSKLGKDPQGFPYTGPNTNSAGVSEGYDSELYAKSQIMVNNGLTIVAQPNTAKLAPGGILYPYLSGALTTVAFPGSGPGVTVDFTLPSTGKWYLQIRCKMPDMSNGIAPCLWFMPGASGGNVNEFDYIQGCFGPQATSNPALYNNFPLGIDFDNGPAPTAPPLVNVGFDSTQAFHMYGIEFNWDAGTVTGYVDGAVVYTHATPPPQSYEIILNVQCWMKGQTWCTGVTGSNSGSWQIAEIQAYSSS
jgi:hypothetical protein